MTEQLDFVDPKEVLNWSYETMCTRSIQYSIDAWDLFIREYPKAVAGHLEDEEEAALHLSKWIAAGGAIDAVSSILLHQKPSFDREKNTAQARENLRLFLQNVVDDPALRLFIAAFDKEIEAISNILHWEILNKNPESFERRSKGGRLPRAEVIEAKQVARDFFPPGYSDSKIARIFVRAVQIRDDFEGYEEREPLSVESIRVAVLTARKKEKNESDIFDRWVKGKGL